jgi:hypothetical protein
MGIRELQHGCTETSSMSSAPGHRRHQQRRRPGLCDVHRWHTAGPAPGRAVLHRPRLGRPRRSHGGLTEPSAPDIIDTLMSPPAHHNLTTECLPSS